MPSRLAISPCCDLGRQRPDLPERVPSSRHDQGRSMSVFDVSDGIPILEEGQGLSPVLFFLSAEVGLGGGGR